jgi:hypothetical protein
VSVVRLVLLALLLLAVASPAFAAVTVNASTCTGAGNTLCPGAIEDTGNSSPLTFSVTVASSSDVLVLCTGSVTSGGLATSATFGAQSFTQVLPATLAPASTTTGDANARMWYLQTPTVGTDTVTVNIAGTGRKWASVVALSGADSGTPFYTPQTLVNTSGATSLTGAQASRATGAVVDCAAVNFSNSVLTKGASQTILRTQVGGTSGNGYGMSFMAGADYSVAPTFSWTNNRPHAYMSMGVNASGAVPTARTINLADCDSATINTEQGQIGNGDTVICPAGSTTTTARGVIRNKYFNLRGGGGTVNAKPTSCSAALTTITNNNSSSSTPEWLAIATIPGGVTEVSGFCIKDTNGVGATGTDKGNLVITGNTDSINVRYNWFEPAAARPALNFKNYVRGVVHRNWFEVATGTAYGIAGFHDAWGNTGTNGHNSWAQASTLGTAEQLFIEDNTFNAPGTSMRFCADGWFGRRWSVRYNTLNNCSINDHGNDSGFRGAFSLELHNNTWNVDISGSTPDGASIRSGTARVVDNTFNVTGGTVSQAFTMATFRNTQYTVGAETVMGPCRRPALTSLTRQSATTARGTTAAVHGLKVGLHINVAGTTPSTFNCTGCAITAVPTTTTFEYTFAGADPGTDASAPGTVGTAWDQNTDSTGYMCMDQPGAGTGDLLSGTTFTTVTPVGFPNQASSPIYVCGNTKNGSAFNVVGDNVTVVLNRDYFLSCDPGWTAYTYPHPLTTTEGSGGASRRPSAVNGASWR